MSWRVTIIGTLLEVGLSVGVVWLVGRHLGWPVGRIILLGFVITHSSTSVILKLFEETGDLDTPVGRHVVGISLMQDLSVVPMLIVLGFFGADRPMVRQVALQAVGGVALLAFIYWLSTRPCVHLPAARFIRDDHEMQVFAALLVCFGMALASSLLGLSAAMGAFVAGVLVNACRETTWVRERLQPFRVVFLGAFFLSIGMLIDLRFLWAHLWQIGFLVVLVFATNTIINAGILRGLGANSADSLYAGSALSQIGEFSFVLAAVGLNAGIIHQFGYQCAISTIALTLLFSPPWIMLVRRLTQRGRSSHAEATEQR